MELDLVYPMTAQNSPCTHEPSSMPMIPGYVNFPIRNSFPGHNGWSRPMYQFQHIQVSFRKNTLNPPTITTLALVPPKFKKWHSNPTNYLIVTLNALQ
jgi:hypothetical protein